MTNLYITADHVGQLNHGGGSVTGHEAQALRTLGPCEVWDGNFLDKVKKYYSNAGEPWQHDASAYTWLNEPRFAGNGGGKGVPYVIAHFYAGTFTATVQALQKRGCKVCYTAAAHDPEVSRREHEALGLPYDYPHLTDPALRQRYLGGYLAADVVVCPSQHSADVMRRLGRTGRIEVIPHGVDLPKCTRCEGTVEVDDPNEPDGWNDCPRCKSQPGIEPVQYLPKQFRVGYLGSCGAPDKGVRYLLQAWKQLAYRDAVLVLAGRDSTSDWVRHLVTTYGGGNIELWGWVPDVADFYNSISCYCQPSVTEGFGIEVLEAMSFGRPVMCSIGVGAMDVVRSGGGRINPVGDVESLAAGIHFWHNVLPGNLMETGIHAREIAADYTWDKIEQRYIALWRGLLGREHA